ncbi:MAG: hypothetical protein IJQ50_02755 [Clostridia bacterium]|nr:hypothetical protein [Clostridia bacterium]
MGKKLKFMSLYIGILFFVVILLILITSMSNVSLDPSYEIITGEGGNNSFDNTLEQNVNTLTIINERLNERVSELADEIENKNKIIEEYESGKNENAEKLNSVAKMYINDEIENAKKEFERIDVNLLDEENATYYESLKNKLK